ncbi:MAG: hypothetical protein K6T92_05705 [Candidatus Rokubacteria bacterium]|nr:hypothetical protein [Candidatus Rokubacteria bacterium]
MRLFAAADALRGEIGVPLPEADRGQVGRTLEAARGALGPQGYEEAWAGGRRLGTRRAIEEALGGTAFLTS